VTLASAPAFAPAPIDGALRAAVHRRLLALPFDPREVDRAELRARVEQILRDEAPLCRPAEAARLLDALVDDVSGLGPLEAWLSDRSVSEVMVNGPGRAYVERCGRLERVDCSLDAEQIAHLAERIVAPLGLRLDHASPLVDARLADGSRVHAVLPPLAPDGPCLTIRRFVVPDVDLDAFDVGTRGRACLEALVRAGWNLVVAGGTSAGKTTLCNALARAIDPAERIVTIEETAELALPQPHVVRLEARPANAEGIGAVTVRELVRTALRMRPDRLIVGEVRGGEALDMLQALNTGHEGSLSTVHANDPAAALARVETLAMFGGVGLPLAAIRAQIAAAIDGVVHVGRGTDGRRSVRSVAEVEADGARVRTLLRREGELLVPVAAPARRPRRAVPAAAGSWPA
jgi:pilus assembly protein CpaF